MTIEIRQLIIRGVARAKEGPEHARSATVEAGPDDEHGRLVAACVKQVLRALERTRER